MRNIITKLGFLCCLLCFFVSDGYAGHDIGADITYSCTGVNTYEVTLNLYRDCNGVNVTSTQTISWVGSCGSGSVSAPKLSTTDVTNYCPSSLTSCGNGGTYGIEKITYQATIVIPPGCTNVYFSHRRCCRTNDITTLYIPGTQSIYVEALVENTSPVCNNSPIFLNAPLFETCIGNQVFYNVGAYDIDNDSLSYSLISCLENAGSSVNYMAGMSGTSPIGPASATWVDNYTGVITFTPTALHVGPICILVEEYRNGQLIGSVMRDVKFQVLACTNITPTVSGINGAGVDSVDFVLSSCLGPQICFNIIGMDVNSGDSLQMFYDGGIPAATFNVTGTGDSINGLFCWTPTIADTGFNSFTVLIKDDVCPVFGTNIFTYVINVSTNSDAPVDAGFNQFICIGDSANLLATTTSPNGVSYTWTPTTGLDNPNIPNPKASPDTTTLYMVELTYANGCSSVDSVLINQPASANTVSILVDSTVKCNGGNDGGATAIAAGGTPGISGYTYVWSDAQTTASATGLTTGVYCVTVTDSLGCNTFDCVTITEPSAVTATIASSMNVNCFGSSTGSATAVGSGGTVSGAYLYWWDTATGSQTTVTASGLSAGVYCVTVIDDNWCSDITCVTITEPTSLNLSLLADDTLCANHSTTVLAQPSGGTSPYTFSWNGGTSNANPFTVLPLPGVVINTITVTDDNGCTVTGLDTITIIPILDSAIVSASLDPFDIGHCQNAVASVLNYNDVTGITFPGIFYGAGVRNGQAGPGLAKFHPDSAVIDMGHTGNVQITYIYQTTTGCFDTTRFTTEVHALPDLSFLNLPDSLCPSDDAFQVLMTNSVTTGLMGQINYLDTLGTQAGIFAITDTSGGFLPNFITLFDTLHPSAAIGYNQINISYSYTADTSLGSCSAMIYDSIIIEDCCVWPGDANNDLIANNFDILPIGLHSGTNGIARNNTSIDWNCKASSEWGFGIIGSPTVDIKHVDCNGDGSINPNDTNAIIQNWGQVHLKSGTSSFATGVDIYLDTATCRPGDTIVLDVFLGQGTAPSNGYGIAFTINYDPLGIDTNSVIISYNNSWLGNINSDMIAIDKDFYFQGQTEVGMVRIDQFSANGGGPICQMQMIIKDDVLPKSNFIRLDFDISNVRFIDSLGNLIQTNAIPSQVLVADTLTKQIIIEDNTENQITIAPNPTSGLLKIQSSIELIHALRIYDLRGRLVQKRIALNEKESLLNLNDLAQGVYILQVESETGTMKNVRVIKH